MKADCLQLEQFLEDGREKMLSRMLLHMVEAPLPVDRALDGSGVQGRGKPVRDPIVLIDDFDDSRSCDCPGVERLPAGCGIERAAIEVDGAATGRSVHDAGRK